MEERFNKQYMWVWFINLVTYIVVITLYFVIDGHEIIYAMYLPLDLLLNLSKALYYFLHFYLDDRAQERELRLITILNQSAKKQFNENLDDILAMNFTAVRTPRSERKLSKQERQMKLAYKEKVRI